MNTSKQLFEEAQKYIPGGVNSPVRAFKSVGGDPIFIEKAKGSHLYDVDGNKYIDYICSWGPMILGHAHPDVTNALKDKIENSCSFGAPTKLETDIAKLICSMVPNLEKVRMVNSGTEACMSAVRLARGYTKRDKIIKFEGCYHGHADAFLIKAGSGASTLGVPNSPGVPEAVANDTLIARYNNISDIEDLVEKHKESIAAIIIEPVAGNMGCILPEADFIRGIRAICDREGIVLIFDEVMTGFRLAKGGAQEVFKVKADLITYGKVIGGGMPVGAYAGKSEIMDSVAPEGPVYQAGTLSGNPIAMTSGLTTLSILNDTPHFYEKLNKQTEMLRNGLEEVLREKGVPHSINHCGSMISVFFSEKPVIDFQTATLANNDLFKKFFHAMLKNGVYLPPSPFESWFTASTHYDDLIFQTIEASRNSLKSI